MGTDDATVGLTLGGAEDFRVLAAAGRRPARMLQLHSGELSTEALTALSDARSADGPRSLRIATEKAEWMVVRLSAQGFVPIPHKNKLGKDYPPPAQDPRYRDL